MPALLNRLTRRHATGTQFTPTDEPVLTPDLMATLRQMRITAPRVQRGTFAGEHRSKRRGSSPEFADFKSYSPGDDIRRVDWNLYARLDSLFVRVSEVTTDLTVHLVLDSSPSMDWRSAAGPYTKAFYARRLAAALGYVTLWHFDRIRVAPFTTALARPLGPLTGRTRVNDLLTYFSVSPDGEATSVAEILHRLGHTITNPGMLVVLSDCLSDEPEMLGRQLRTLISRGWDVIVIQTLDPSEVDPTLLFSDRDRNQPMLLTDSEADQRILMLPGDESCQRYLDTFRPWQAAMISTVKGAGGSWLQLRTDQTVEPTVLQLLHMMGLLS